MRRKEKQESYVEDFQKRKKVKVRTRRHDKEKGLLYQRTFKRKGKAKGRVSRGR